MSSRVSVLSSHKREGTRQDDQYFLREPDFGGGREMTKGIIRVPFGSNPNGTLSWPALYVNRGCAEDPALEMMSPVPDGVDSMFGSHLIKLIDPLEESADRARVNIQVIVGDSTNQTISIASQGQECCPERRVLGVEGCVRDALRSARDCRPDRVPSRFVDRRRLTL